jgi:hypothetical protein
VKLRFPIEDGMVPVRLLWERMISGLDLNEPNEEGIEPVKWLRSKRREMRFES